MELNQKELQRIKVIENAVEGRIPVAKAGELLGLSERQVKRLKRRYQAATVEWVRHGNIGRRRAWALKQSVRRKIVNLARTKYAGFNDTHLCEKLADQEGVIPVRTKPYTHARVKRTRQWTRHRHRGCGVGGRARPATWRVEPAHQEPHRLD